MFLIFALFSFIFSIKASCPDGNFEWENECYFFPNVTLGFADAETFCNPLGGHLASIHDGFINTLIAEKAHDNFTQSTVTDIWIGLTDLFSYGNWTWMDDTSLNFRNWASSEPQNATGSNCVSLSLTNGQWKAEDCFKEKPFVCKVTTTSYPVYANCSEHFIYFEPTHSCYGYGEWSDALNWPQAEQYCLKIGGHSTSIHSYDELHFLKSFVFLAYKGIWSGAFSNDGGKSWKWSDDTEWDFNPWEEGRPNMNTSACGGIGGWGLFDRECSIPYRIVCKINL